MKINSLHIASTIVSCVVRTHCQQTIIVHGQMPFIIERLIQLFYILTPIFRFRATICLRKFTRYYRSAIGNRHVNCEFAIILSGRHRNHPSAGAVAERIANRSPIANRLAPAQPSQPLISQGAHNGYADMIDRQYIVLYWIIHFISSRRARARARAHASKTKIMFDGTTSRNQCNKSHRECN